MKTLFIRSISIWLLWVLLLSQAEAARILFAPDEQTSGPTTQSQNSSESENQTDSNKRRGKHADNVLMSATFSEEVAAELIGRLSNALENHNARTMLSTFDSAQMDGYVNFQNQIDTLFQSYDLFRVHFRIAEVGVAEQKHTAVVDFELEESAGSGNLPSVRKENQLRFEMARGSKGWKIVDVTPRSFFS